MKGYQIWMECYIEDPDDWYSSSGHTEYQCYSEKVYLDKNKATEIMNSINKDTALHTCGLDASHCENLYLKEIEIE